TLARACGTAGHRARKSCTSSTRTRGSTRWAMASLRCCAAFRRRIRVTSCPAAAWAAASSTTWRSVPAKREVSRTWTMRISAVPGPGQAYARIVLRAGMGFHRGRIANRARQLQAQRGVLDVAPAHAPRLEARGRSAFSCREVILPGRRVARVEADAGRAERVEQPRGDGARLEPAAAGSPHRLLRLQPIRLEAASQHDVVAAQLPAQAGPEPAAASAQEPAGRGEPRVRGDKVGPGDAVI